MTGGVGLIGSGTTLALILQGQVGHRRCSSGRRPPALTLVSTVTNIRSLIIAPEGWRRQQPTGNAMAFAVAVACLFCIVAFGVTAYESKPEVRAPAYACMRSGTALRWQKGTASIERTTRSVRVVTLARWSSGARSTLVQSADEDHTAQHVHSDAHRAAAQPSA